MGQSCFNSSFGPGFCQVFLPQIVLSQAGPIPIHILSDTKYSKLPSYYPPLALLQRNPTGCNLGDGQWFGIFLFVYPEPLWGGSRNNCQVPPGPFTSAPRELPGPFGVCSGVGTQEGWVHSCPGSGPRALWGSHQPPLGIVAPLLSKDHVTNVEACFLSMC